MGIQVNGTFTGVATTNFEQHVNNTYDITKTVYKNGSRHKIFERNCWMINGLSGLIAFPFYPIVSAIGHSIIEGKYGKENAAHGKIKNYLDEKLSSNREVPFYLDSEDLNYIHQIFKDFNIKKGYLPTSVENVLSGKTDFRFSYGRNRKDMLSDCCI